MWISSIDTPRCQSIINPTLTKNKQYRGQANNTRKLVFDKKKKQETNKINKQQQQLTRNTATNQSNKRLIFVEFLFFDFLFGVCVFDAGNWYWEIETKKFTKKETTKQDIQHTFNWFKLIHWLQTRQRTRRIEIKRNKTEKIPENVC